MLNNITRDNFNTKLEPKFIPCELNDRYYHKCLLYYDLILPLIFLSRSAEIPSVFPQATPSGKSAERY